MQLIQEVAGVNSNFANRLQRQKTADYSFFFHVTLTRSTGELQQLKAIRWSVGTESHVSFQEKENKTNAARKYSCWLDTKKHWCLNYEPNSAYNLLVSRVLMNYFMREESIFRCYMFNCIHIVVRTH